MTIVLGKLPTSTTEFGQAREVYLQHIDANGTGGHTARDEWRNCQHPMCGAFADSIGGRKQFRVTQDGQP